MGGMGGMPGMGGMGGMPGMGGSESAVSYPIIAHEADHLAHSGWHGWTRRQYVTSTSLSRHRR